MGSSLAAGLPSGGSKVRAALVLAAIAAAPDLDVLAFGLGIPYESPLGHRGLTHSLFFALVVAAFSAPLWRRSAAYRSRWAVLAVLTFVACASHGLLDTLTDAGLGIGLFIPFDDTRYFAPWRPILTSPLSARAFFSGAGASILANEAVWVGLPALLFVSLASAVRLAADRR